MPHWYYIENRTRKGPVDRDTLTMLITTGKVPADTLVWNEELADWTPAHAVRGVVPVGTSTQPVPPPVPATPPPPVPASTPRHVASAQVPPHAVSATPPASGTTSRFIAAGPQVRPWIRFWARGIDYALLGGLLVIILMAIAPERTLEMSDDPGTGLAFGIAVVFLWVFIEAALVASIGTTPAKALLNVRVRHPDGSLLSFNEALKRSFGVWFSGVVMGIPLISTIFAIIWYFRLKESGTTPWDACRPWQVQHRPVGWIRSVALAVILLVWFLLSIPVPES